MNILTDIRVDGEVFAEYAFLTYEFFFKNADKAAVSAEYSFTLPDRAVISDAKIISDSEIISLSVIPLSHAAALWDGSEAAILRRIDKNLYSLKLGSITNGGCRLAMHIYVSVREGLTIPVICENGAAKIELSLHGIASVQSRTHNIDISKTEDGLCVKTGKISADRDFCIRLTAERRGNSAIAVHRCTEGEMICRIRYDAMLAKRYKRLMLLCDRASLYGGSFYVARELMCAMASLWNGEFAVSIIGDEKLLITDGFITNTTGNISDLIKRLGDTSEGSTVELSEYINDETLPVVICGGSAAISGIDGVCAVTLGASARSVLMCEKIEHIYGKDDIKLRAAEILKSFTEPKVTVDAYNAAADVKVMHAEANFCDLYVRYKGDAPPTEFSLTVNGVCMSAVIEKSAVYKSFNAIGLAYAEILQTELEHRIRLCAPGEVQKIRMEIEATGVKFSALNSETALAAVTGNGRPSPVRVVISDRSSVDVFGDRSSMFRESNARLTAAEADSSRDECLEIVFMNIRACGGIFTAGEINPEMQKYQTAVCYLALAAAGILSQHKEIAEAAADFAKDFSHKLLRLTENAVEADEILGKLFGRADIIYGDRPDVLTAAKVLWLRGDKNNSRFC